ncbi:unnamed protein product [Adineta steineri]|uniref:Transmembrane protein n=1 Tax=Adineta steineri TaxID=433720 RepID=A0A814MUA8_9BILA|nr:unnamed protein product [Adineta steineri]CAF4140790.1 unnamed protein product [Adineta steineri]
MFIDHNSSPSTRGILWRQLEAVDRMERLALAIDPQNLYVYVVQTGQTLCLDINLNTTIVFMTNDLWDSEWIFSQTLVITKDHYLFLLAYRAIETEEFIPYMYVTNLFNISDPIRLSMTNLSAIQASHSVFDSGQYTTLSISVDKDSNIIIVGMPFLDTVLILSFHDKSKPPVIIKEIFSSQNGALFGKSVAILDENYYAVLAQSMSTLPWSLSQIYSLHDLDPKPKPIFVFPNNQQPMQKMHIMSSPFSITSLHSCSPSTIGLVLNPSTVLLLPASPPGYCSSIIEKYTEIDAIIYRSKSCIPGTFQENMSFGPCIICPSQSKNNGSSGVICDECVLKNTSICFLGAINEIDLISLVSYDQTTPYLESPESTQFDDLLLQNIFKFPDATIQCLFISPIFWGFFTIILCLIIFILIKLILYRSKYKNRSLVLKKLFVHIDLISEGQFWLGGLISLSLFVLIIFACKFSISFASLYPIEQVSSDERLSVSCDGILFNAKLTSSLQLLSTHTYKEKTIFTLLDEQNITLTAEFISTGFGCDDLAIQLKRAHGLSITLKIFNCSTNNSIIYVSFILPQHVITMYFDILGPYFVGALRICFSAPSVIIDNGTYTAQQLDYCQSFFTPNKTLTSNPVINVKMTKVINRTASMTLLDEVTYTGLWLPTLAMNTLTDDLLFSEKGEFYRYVRSHMTLVMDITESEFYVKNTQEPIARTYEITFNTILFFMLCLDLVGLLFIGFKLAILPLILLIQKRFFHKQKNKSSISKDHHIYETTIEESFKEIRKHHRNNNNNQILTNHKNWFIQSKF